MRKAKKWLALAMVAAMTVMTVSGCTKPSENKGGDSEKKDEETKKEEVVTIDFWDQSGTTIREEIYKVLIERFEAENPNIKVNYVSIPSSDAKSKYDVAIQSKTTPDCGGVLEYWMADFIMQDALYPLDTMIDNWDGKDGMLDTIMESIRSMDPENNTYALAQTVTLPTVWYNTTTLEEAGIAIPQNWDDVFSAVEQTTDKNANKYGFSIRGGAGSSQQFEQMMYQYSGILEMYDADGNSTVNAPEHVELLEKFAAIYNVYTPESDVTNGYAEMVSAFGTGSASMIFHNLGSYGEHEKALGIGNFGALTTLKSVKNTDVLVSNGSTALSVFSTSKHPEEAFKFISYLADHAGSSYYAEQIGQMPCNSEALKDAWVKELPHMESAANALLNKGTGVATLPIEVSGYYDLHSNELVEGFQQVLLQKITAQEYLDNWAANMTQLKAEYDAYLNSAQ